MPSNPLYRLAEFPQFNSIRPEHGVEAVRALISDAEKAVSVIEAVCPATWNGRIKAAHDATAPVWRTWGVIEHLISVSNGEEWRKVEETLQPEIVTFAMRIMQSRPLYDALMALQTSEEFTALDEGRKRVIASSIRSAHDSGIGLEGEQKASFNAIVNELSSLSMKFSNNILDATKAFSLMLRDKADVAGLPATLLEACAQSARAADETSATPELGPWRITLEYSVYGPFMQYSERRDLRETLYRASIARASEGTRDNRPLIDRILSLRRQMAEILGYKSYSELGLAAKMAANAEAVYSMIDTIGNVAIPKAHEELADLQEFAEAHGFCDGKLMNWDVSYWARLQVEERYGYSPEHLRPYFQLENVLQGLFTLVGKLTGIKVIPADGLVPVWHQDVRFFRVTNASGSTLAWFYLDPYSRPETKRGGAWMNEFQTREMLPEGTLKLPIALIVCNQAVPSGGKPSCMTPIEINTLFHEFGHAIQHMLTQVDIPEASGINNIEWDAVEVASQFLENWCSQPEVLRDLSCHVDTGEKLDEKMLSRIHASDTHHAAMQTVRQLRFALVDMDLHTKFPSKDFQTVADVEKASAERFAVIPPLPEDRFLCSFSHIFSGGYSAGYYSYLWAEVLAADAFGLFEEHGLDNAEAVSRLGRRYTDTILALGGTRHPMDVFKAFRGRAPEVQALLKQKGLISEGSTKTVLP